MKKAVIKYLSAIAAGGVFTLLVLLINGFFTTDVAIIKYKLLADAFGGPGIIMILLPVLFWISTDGFFDGITYALSRFGQMITFRGALKQEKYYDYKQRKAQKRMSGFWFILFVGLGFVLVSGVFLVFFYTNGGSEAYRVAIGY